jgi:serine/threonine-protein kinase
MMARTLGAYVIDDEIGSGGMATVYRGRQVALDRPVALKLLLPNLANNPDFVTRVEREARSNEGFVVVFEATDTRNSTGSWRVGANSTGTFNTSFDDLLVVTP